MELPAHPELDPAWNHIRNQVRRTVGDGVYEIWLSRLRVSGWDGSVLRIEADREKRQWIADRFGAVLQRCAREVLGHEVQVTLADDRGSGLTARPTPAGATHAEDLPPAEEFNPRFTFEQFIIGDGNRLAHAAALAVAEHPGHAYNPLFLHAPPGLGKTHLLHAIGNYIRRFDPGTTVRYTTVEAFTNGFIAALTGHALARFKDRYRAADVLLIDDVQFLMSKHKTEEEFFHTFNALHESGRQLVLTCDRLPEKLVGLELRLRERFESGLVAHLTPPDLATRTAILRKRADLDDIPALDDGILELIAQRVPDNIRSLEGALIRIVAHHSLTGQPVDARLARTVLDEIHPQTADAKGLDPHRIQAVVAERSGISVNDLVSTKRAAAIAWARQLAMYLTRELLGLPLGDIGLVFGGRNHATVLYACRRVEERRCTSQEDAQTVQNLLAALGSESYDRGC